LESGDVWLDTGTIASLSEASQFVETIQHRKGIVIGSPELTAYEEGFINESQLRQLAKQYTLSGYGDCLLKGLKL
jgi:glucose-1-phosphate thymidylyltransferase